VREFELPKSVGQFEYAIHVRRPTQNHEASRAFPGPDACVDDCVNARAVDESKIAQVKDDQARRQQRVSQSQLQPGSGRDVQLAGRMHANSVWIAVDQRALEHRRHRRLLRG
jgi:hypothetical protein